MDLSNIDLLSLQTSYMQQDKTVQVLCKILNPYFQKLSHDIKNVLIYSRIDELDEKVIDELAWQFHVDFYDYTLPIENKRNLVKNSIWLHKIKGTPQAVIDAASSVFGKAKLKEWFEYDGKPFFFGLDVDITDIGATPENLKKLDTLVNAYKNTRSWVDFINLYIASKGNINIAAITVIGEEISVLPWEVTQINVKFDIPIPVQCCSSEVIQVYPKEE